MDERGRTHGWGRLTQVPLQLPFQGGLRVPPVSPQDSPVLVVAPWLPSPRDSWAGRPGAEGRERQQADSGKGRYLQHPYNNQALSPLSSYGPDLHACVRVRVRVHVCAPSTLPLIISSSEEKKNTKINIHPSSTPLARAPTKIRKVRKPPLPTHHPPESPRAPHPPAVGTDSLSARLRPDAGAGAAGTIWRCPLFLAGKLEEASSGTRQLQGWTQGLSLHQRA